MPAITQPNGKVKTRPWWQYLGVFVLMLVALGNLGIVWCDMWWGLQNETRVEEFRQREEPLLKADPRFTQVQLYFYTGGAVGVMGKVQSREDSEALLEILKRDNDTGLPIHWTLRVVPAGRQEMNFRPDTPAEADGAAP